MALTQPIDPPDTEPPAEESRVTPAMAQFIEIKAANPDCLLFYRMGDFYEMFFEDAEIASRALGIVLTKRGKYLGKDVPLCGVPVVRADEYLHRLIALGHRVAVCEQLEDPAEARKRGSKSVVHRDVVRLVTAGTLTEDSLLDARRNNYLLAVARARLSSASEDARFALAWIDISTGEFRVTECEQTSLSAEIARLEPGEIIVSDALFSDADLAAYWRSLPVVMPVTRDVFDGATAERRLASFFAVATSEAFGPLTRLELTAAAACVTYVERTQIGQRPALSPPLRESAGASMAIDQATRGNLELMRTLTGERRGSLLDAIDRTVTAAGSRLLAQRLAAPLTDPAQIARRLDAVTSFTGDGVARAETRSRLAAAPDLARALSRISVDRGGPRDLAAIRDGVLAAADLARALATRSVTPPPCGEGSGVGVDVGEHRRLTTTPLPNPPPQGGGKICRRTSPMRCRPAASPTGCLRPNCRRRWPPICLRSSATADSCAKATIHRSMRRARCAMNRAASLPPCRRATPKTPAFAFSRSSTTTYWAISSR